MYGFPLAVASRMMICFDVRGKSADMAEMEFYAARLKVRSRAIATSGGGN